MHTPNHGCLVRVTDDLAMDWEGYLQLDMPGSSSPLGEGYFSGLRLCDGTRFGVPLMTSDRIELVGGRTF